MADRSRTETIIVSHISPSLSREARELSITNIRGEMNFRWPLFVKFGQESSHGYQKIS